jgi:ABC-type sugar transport system ATPase subunit
MNFVRSTVSRSSRGLRLASPAFAIDGVPEEGGWPSEILLGVRPHEIALTGPGEGHGIGRAEIVELLGSTTLIHLRVDGESDGLLRIVVPSDVTVAVDDPVGFRVNVDRLHVFDERTGQRLNRSA